LINLRALCLNAVFMMFSQAYYEVLRILRQFNLTIMPIYCHKIGAYDVLLRNYRYIDVIMLFLRRYCENYAVTWLKLV
jgi:hypothetical protein